MMAKLFIQRKDGLMKKGIIIGREGLIDMSDGRAAFFPEGEVGNHDLICAKLEKISADGILLSGFEDEPHRPGQKCYYQEWWLEVER